MDATPPGLRERKKQQTRQRISDRATELFLRRGFDDVTIAEIAAAAEVSKMTVTNYFPRKEDIALDLREAFVGRLVAAVAGRGPSESVLEVLRRDYLAAVAEHDPVIGFSGRPFAQMIADSPALLARLRDLHDQREQALLDALLEEGGPDPDDPMPRVAAALLGSLHRLLFQETFRRTLAGETDEQIADAVAGRAEIAFDVLAPALGDYGRRRPPRGEE